jgi:hypothetical protein
MVQKAVSDGIDRRKGENGPAMNDVCTYLIQVCGQVDISEINALGPVAMTVERVQPTATMLAVYTDQSGLIGLMRHLHGLRFVFLSVSRTERA